MKSLKLFASKCWRIFFFVNLVLTFLVFFPLFYILLQKENWFKYAFKLKQLWGRFILHDCGVFISIKREAELDKNTAYIFCPNHTSYLDIMTSYLVIPQYFSFIGKAGLANIPLFGMFFTKGMDIAIERNSMTASFKAMQKAGDYLDKGISINIFPEGTIPDSVPKLGTYKNGPFKLAINKQMPIVPVTFKDNWKILPYEKTGKKGGGPGIVHAVMHKPIPTKGMTDNDVEKLKIMVREVIEKELGLID